MAISGVSLASATSFQNPNDPRQQLLQLAQAINSGDLTGAQQAYAQLTQTLGNTSTSNSTSGIPSDPFSQALAAIGQSLQSGSIQGAQQALASLQAQGGRGHHHHGGGRHSDAGSNANASTTALTAPGTGANVDVTA